MWLLLVHTGLGMGLIVSAGVVAMAFCPIFSRVTGMCLQLVNRTFVLSRRLVIDSGRYVCIGLNCRFLFI